MELAQVVRDHYQPAAAGVPAIINRAFDGNAKRSRSDPDPPPWALRRSEAAVTALGSLLRHFVVAPALPKETGD